MDFGPKNEEERRIFAEENLVADVQFAIQKLLNRKGMTRSDLATLLGVSNARVTQVMGTAANPTLRMLARMLFALDVQPEVTLAGPLFCIKGGKSDRWTQKDTRSSYRRAAFAAPTLPEDVWQGPDLGRVSGVPGA